MTEEKHYQYEGHVDLSSTITQNESDIEIVGYDFLMPCKIKTKVKGQETVQMVNVNLVDRKVYDQNGKEWSEALSEKFFIHIEEVNTLPEDFYSADDETVESAGEAKKEFDEIRNHQYGESF